MASVVDKEIRFGPRDAGTLMTLDEFERADYVEGYRYELINGVLVVNPPPLEQRDYQEKKNEYRDIHVEEYWIIDRFSRAMTVYRWRGARWTKPTVGEDEIYATKLLPGFALPLRKLFGLADKYRRDESEF